MYKDKWVENYPKQPGFSAFHARGATDAVIHDTKVLAESPLLTVAIAKTIGQDDDNDKIIYFWYFQFSLYFTNDTLKS